MYATAEQIYNLSAQSTVKGCGVPIFRESFDHYDKPPESQYKRIDYFDVPKYQFVNPLSASQVKLPSGKEHFSAASTAAAAVKEDHNVKPDLWGPSQWIALHFSAVGYEDTPSNITKQAMKNRIKALPYEIPCEKCRSHCLAYVESADIETAVSSRENLFKFYFDFHNKVNTRLGKGVLNYDRAKELYGF